MMESTSQVEASQREVTVPHEGDPASALLTTHGIFSTNSGSSPRCLLDDCLDLWGLEEAIWYKQQSVECMCGEILILVPLQVHYNVRDYVE